MRRGPLRCLKAQQRRDPAAFDQRLRNESVLVLRKNV